MRKFLLLLACIATMTASAQTDLPLTGNGATLKVFYPSFSPLEVNFTAAWGNGVNLVANFTEGLSVENYPKCTITLDEITTEGSNMGITIKHSDGSSDTPLSTTAANGTYTYDLTGTAMKSVLFRSRNGEQHVVIKKFALINKEGNEVETQMAIVDNASTPVAATSGVVTFSWNWAELGGTNWVVPFEDGQKLVYNLTFNEPVAGATFQAKATFDDGTGDKYLEIPADATEFEYTVTNPSVKTVSIQCKDKTKTLNIASATVTVMNTSTAISTVNTIDANAPVFNIAGQRVAAGTKGILIQNGKKFVVK